MNPTPHQLKLLQLYREFHAAPPTPGRLLRRNRWPIALFVFLIVAGLYVAQTRGDWWVGVGYFAAGIGFGALSRVIRHLANSLRYWPVISQIVDWTKVESMLGKPQS